MAKRDYYDILGVSKGASDDELKRAYRKVAMKYHPDRNPDDKDAEQKFKEAGEAYDALKDPQKRAAYDQFGHAAFEQGMGGGAGAGGAGHGFGGFDMGGDFGDMFDDLFGDVFGGGRGHGASNRGADLRYNLSVDLDDAYKGKTVQVKIPTSVACDTCHGSGAKPGTKPKACNTCGGRGQVRVSQGFFSMTRTCPACHGRGEVITDPCRSCHGSGRVNKEKTISVNIPKGVDNGTRIRLSGEGEAGAQGGPAGDLYIFIQLKPHPIFKRDGKDLFLEVPLAFSEAALGGQIEVPTPDGGRARLTIPEGTQTGQSFRLRGKGMPVLSAGQFGDLYVSAKVEVPTKLTKKQKELLREFQDACNDKNNPEQESFLKKASRFWKAAS